MVDEFFLVYHTDTQTLGFAPVAFPAARRGGSARRGATNRFGNWNVLARRIYGQPSGGGLIKLPWQWFRPDLISSWLVLSGINQLFLHLSSWTCRGTRHRQLTWFMSTFWLASSHTSLSPGLIEDTGCRPPKLHQVGGKLAKTLLNRMHRNYRLASQQFV